MHKISLLDINDLEEAYEIEVSTNPSPWSFDNFKSSFEVGHHGLVCKEEGKMLGFLIFSPIKPEAHLLSCLLYTSDACRRYSLCRSRWSPYH